MPQSSFLDGVFFSPFSLPQNGLASPEVHVSWRQVLQALKHVSQALMSDRHGQT